MTTFIAEPEVEQKTEARRKRRLQAFGLDLAYFGVMASLLMLSVILLATANIVDMTAQGFTALVILNAISVGVIAFGVLLRHINK